MSKPFLRGKVYWVRFTDPSGQLVRESTGTGDKRSAQEYLDARKAAGWRQSKLGEKSDRLWEEAAARWLQEKAGKRSIRDDADKIVWFNERFAGKRLGQLTDDLIQDVVEKQLGHRATATRNKYYALMGGILNRAATVWKWTDRTPHIQLHPPTPGIVRYLTPVEAKALLAELPAHMRPVFVFMFATGLRMRNATHLEWSQVDLKRKTMTIQGHDIKNGATLGLPLNNTAFEVLMQQKGKHKTRVFTFDGNPIDNVNTAAFRKAKKRAGIEDFRVHDSRHTWASWVRQNGGTSDMLQELGGWKDATMVRKYAHLAPEHMAPTAAIIDGVLA